LFLRLGVEDSSFLEDRLSTFSLLEWPRTGVIAPDESDENINDAIDELGDSVGSIGVSGGDIDVEDAVVSLLPTSFSSRLATCRRKSECDEDRRSAALGSSKVSLSRFLVFCIITLDCWIFGSSDEDTVVFVT